MRAIGWAFLASMAVSGSGSAAAQDGAGAAYMQAFNTAFAKAFREKFITQCVSHAQASSSLKADFTPVCGCSADRLLATKSIAELSKGPMPEDSKAVVAACVREHPLRPAG